MIKFKVTPTRFAEVCNIVEYITMAGGNLGTAARILPRFILDDSDEYVVKVVLDEDGDIKEYEGLNEAFNKLTAVTPKRLEQLSKQLSEAAKAIVNPPNEGD